MTLSRGALPNPPMDDGDSPPIDIQRTMKNTITSLLLLGALLAGPAALAKGAARGGKDRSSVRERKTFERGCILHVGVTRVESRKPAECRDWDRTIDNSDGPSRGGVRSR